MVPTCCEVWKAWIILCFRRHALDIMRQSIYILQISGEHSEHGTSISCMKNRQVSCRVTILSIEKGRKGQAKTTTVGSHLRLGVTKNNTSVWIYSQKATNIAPHRKDATAVYIGY